MSDAYTDEKHREHVAKNKQQNKNNNSTRGTLALTEPHPAINSALEYYNSLPYQTLVMYQESFASNAIEGNRLAEICSETLNRLFHDEPVSDRYFLGLVWTIIQSEMRLKNENK